MNIASKSLCGKLNEENSKTFISWKFTTICYYYYYNPVA